jgi:hypothetical protein
MADGVRARYLILSLVRRPPTPPHHSIGADLHMFSLPDQHLRPMRHGGADFKHLFPQHKDLKRADWFQAPQPFLRCQPLIACLRVGRVELDGLHVSGEGVWGLDKMDGYPQSCSATFRLPDARQDIERRSVTTILSSSAGRILLTKNAAHHTP